MDGSKEPAPRSALARPIAAVQPHSDVIYDRRVLVLRPAKDQLEETLSPLHHVTQLLMEGKEPHLPETTVLRRGIEKAEACR